MGDEALLIYHNAAYPKMIDCANGTDHLQNGAGKRTHFVQLNAAARVMVAKRCVQSVIVYDRVEILHAYGCKAVQPEGVFLSVYTLESSGRHRM